MKISILCALLITGIAATRFNVDATHGHSPKWLEELIAKRQSDPNSEHLYVHLLTHTHDDVGWLKTYEEYFTGTNQGVTIANVKLILDTTIETLLRNPEYRFTYVEIKFFSMWWDKQTTELQDQVRTLVNEGRLEFVNAGWSMHDEACTHYDDMMNNMMIG